MTLLQQLESQSTRYIATGKGDGFAPVSRPEFIELYAETKVSPLSKEEQRLKEACRYILSLENSEPTTEIGAPMRVLPEKLYKELLELLKTTGTYNKVSTCCKVSAGIVFMQDGISFDYFECSRCKQPCKLTE